MNSVTSEKLDDMFFHELDLYASAAPTTEPYDTTRTTPTHNSTRPGYHQTKVKSDDVTPITPTSKVASNPDEIPMVNVTLKCLRLNLAESQEYQDAFISSRCFRVIVNMLRDTNIHQSTSDEVLRVLGNACVDNKNNTTIVCALTLEPIILLVQASRVCIPIVARLLYIFQLDRQLESYNMDVVVMACLDHIAEYDDKHSFYLVTQLVMDMEIISGIINVCTPKQWEVLIQVMDHCVVNVENSLALMSHFKTAMLICLRRGSTCLESVKMLLAVEHMSDQSDRFIPLMADDSEMLRVSIETLEYLVKECETQRQSEWNKVTPVGIEFKFSPFDGLKCHMVQFIGNIVYKDTEKQDLAREYGALQLVAKCCDYDARNPFIKERSIFAIKCLTEKNQKNQDIYGQMRRII